MTTPEQKSHFSCEFFPPKTDKGMEKLIATCDELNHSINPEFFSVTFGAGGSTRDRTRETIVTLKKSDNELAPHISCIGSTHDEVRSMLKTYIDLGVKRLVTLRGDIPDGENSPREFNYANELIEFIRSETGDHFYIEAAAYPEYHPDAPTPADDLANFIRKMKSGANSAITQYFFNTDAYFRFVDECRKLGVDTHITPGIMPITNYSGLARFSDVCGAEIPRWIRNRLEAFGDDTQSLQHFGEEVVTELCRQLLDGGAPGLHFYTLNQATPTINICNNLNSR